MAGETRVHRTESTILARGLSQRRLVSRLARRKVSRFVSSTVPFEFAWLRPLHLPLVSLLLLCSSLQTPRIAWRRPWFGGCHSGSTLPQFHLPGAPNHENWAILLQFALGGI